MRFFTLGIVLFFLSCSMSPDSGVKGNIQVGVSDAPLLKRTYADQGVIVRFSEAFLFNNSDTVSIWKNEKGDTTIWQIGVDVDVLYDITGAVEVDTGIYKGVKLAIDSLVITYYEGSIVVPLAVPVYVNASSVEDIHIVEGETVKVGVSLGISSAIDFSKDPPVFKGFNSASAYIVK